MEANKDTATGMEPSRLMRIMQSAAKPLVAPCWLVKQEISLWRLAFLSACYCYRFGLVGASSLKQQREAWLDLILTQHKLGRLINPLRLINWRKSN